MTATRPPRKNQSKFYIDPEELKIWLTWVFVLSCAAVLWLWGGCTAVPAHIVHQPTVPPTRCRVVLRSTTANVLVLIRRDCIKLGVTTALFIILNPLDKGRQASLDAIEILRKFFGTPPELAPVAISATPEGYPAFLFVCTSFPTKTENQIRRDLWLRQRLRKRPNLLDSFPPAP